MQRRQGDVVFSRGVLYSAKTYIIIEKEETETGEEEAIFATLDNLQTMMKSELRCEEG